MRLKYDFEAVDMGDEYILVPIGKDSQKLHGVLKLNHEGKEIVDLLKTDITEDRIIDFLSSQYDNDRNELKGYVQKTLATLHNAGIVEE